MKPYIIVCLALTIGFTASAQDHKADIKQTANLYVAAVVKQDYAGTIQYMYPGRVAFYGGKDKLIEQMQAEAKQNAAQNIHLKNILLGEPGPVVKYGAMLYSVVPDTVIFQFYSDKGDLGVTSSFVALSADDGKSWTFATIENMKWLTSALPDVAKLNIPKPIQLGILDNNDKPRPAETRNSLTYVGRRALALVVVTHKEEYLTDTIGIKLLKEQGILKKDGIGDDIDPGPNDTAKYGNDAANGIVRFIIDDKKYPNAYHHIIKTMKYVGPAAPQASTPGH
jgi:hypothetical protein